MTEKKQPPIKQNTTPADHTPRVHWWVINTLQVIMALGLALALYEQQWLNATVIVAIILLIHLPAFLGRRLKVLIPPEFEMLAIAFVFAALFLGEVRNYYERFWWWDVALHTTSGLLLGILGFLLIYLLNEDEHVDLHVRPPFVALFAFVFAVAVGAVWEIFEFSMDRLLGMNMQKPMFGDMSGLTDTMWDLIVDTLGAMLISVLGYWHMKRGTKSFMQVWIRKFVDKNPHLFK